MLAVPASVHEMVESEIQGSAYTDQRDGRLVAIDDRRGSRVDQPDGISRGRKD